MLDQITFDRSEEIAEALHEQDGLSRATIGYVASLNLPADQEHVIFALLHGQAHARNRAMHAAGLIAHSGRERRPDG